MTITPLRAVARRLVGPAPRRLFLATLLAAAFLAAWFGLGFRAAATIGVSVDGEVIFLRTRAGSVGEALDRAGVPVGGRDVLEPPAETPIVDGMIVELRRARAVVFAFPEREVTVLTAARTVGEILETTRIRVGPDDRLEPGRDHPVSEGLRVVVTEVVRSFQHRKDEIPFATVEREDMTMTLGQRAVVQEGVPGLLYRLLLVVYENGRQVSSEELSREVLAQPTSRIVKVGTAGTIVRDGQTIRFLKRLTVTATAYEPGPISCGAYADGYTAVGLRATRGIIAVDPRVIPLWTRVYVDGYGFAVAGDVGSAIKGNRIDVCYDTYEEAMRWGVRRVNVYILELPSS
ncbi:MAG: ubiquitin-like domain-containing protein [Bacillota bacterium]